MLIWAAMFATVILGGALLSWGLSVAQRWADRRAVRRRLDRICKEIDRERGRVAE